MVTLEQKVIFLSARKDNSLWNSEDLHNLPCVMSICKGVHRFGVAVMASWERAMNGLCYPQSENLANGCWKNKEQEGVEFWEQLCVFPRFLPLFPSWDKLLWTNNSPGYDSEVKDIWREVEVRGGLMSLGIRVVNHRWCGKEFVEWGQPLWIVPVQCVTPASQSFLCFQALSDLETTSEI